MSVPRSRALRASSRLRGWHEEPGEKVFAVALRSEVSRGQCLHSGELDLEFGYRVGIRAGADDRVAAGGIVAELCCPG